VRDRISDWDRRGLVWIYGIRHPLATKFFQIVSHIGSTPFWVVVGLICYVPSIVFFLFFPALQNLAQFLLTFCTNLFAAFLVSGFILIPLKYAIYRQRPYMRYGDIPSRDIYVVDPSFPSGHCAQWVFYGWVASVYLLGNWYLILVAASLPLIMLSRIYLGSHFPSDTIAGAAIGVGIIFLLMLLIPFFSTWIVWFVQNVKAVVNVLFGEIVP